MTHFNPEDLPEGMPDQIVQQLRRQAQAYDDLINEFNVFFTELSPEQLFTLSKLLHAMTDSNGGPRMAAHYEGWCDAILTAVHHRCRACGKDHTEEIAAGAIPHPAEVPDREGDDDLIDSNVIDRNWSYPPGVEPHFTLKQTRIMAEYDLDDSYTEHEGSTVYVGVVCNNCGMAYPSPEDRAMKPTGPEGCSGCQQKARWG